MTERGRLTITEGLVRSIITEVAPVVETLTGWDLAIDRMGVRVITRDRAYEEVYLARLHGLGLWQEHLEAAGVLEHLAEYVVERTIVAAYDHLATRLLVVSTNVDEGNLDALRVIVGHELVHRGQAVHHPELFAQLDQVILAVIRDETMGLREAIAQVQPMMKLIEGHASLVTTQLRRRYPSAQFEHPPWLPGLILGWVAGLKMEQYEAAESLTDLSDRAQLQMLYADADYRNCVLGNG